MTKGGILPMRFILVLTLSMLGAASLAQPQITVDYCTQKDVTIDGQVINDTAPNLAVKDGTVIEVAAGIGLCRVIVQFSDLNYAYVTLRAGTKVTFQDIADTEGYDIELDKGSFVVDEFCSSKSTKVAPPFHVRPRKRRVVYGGQGTSYLVSATGDTITTAVLDGQVDGIFSGTSSKVEVKASFAVDAPSLGTSFPATRSATSNELSIIRQHLSNATLSRLEMSDS